MAKINELINDLDSILKNKTTEEKIDLINELKIEIHKRSPMNKEPVDCVIWVQADKVQANNYNPNSVAPPEMKLLETSIKNDGYTQPIVGWVNDKKEYEVIEAP